VNVARFLITTAAFSAFATMANAQGGMSGGMQRGMSGGMMGPPQEAIDICTGKAQGDACSFQTPRGEMVGTCNATPNNPQITVCMPQGAPGMGGGQGGPQGSPMGMGGPQGGMQQGQMGRPQFGGGQMGQQRPSRFGGNPQGGMGSPGGRMVGADIDAKYSGAIDVTSKVPDTQQGSCFNTGAKTDCPAEGHQLYGQDANYHGAEPSYTDNADGSVTDNITGLLWEKAHHPKRIGYYDAKRYCKNLNLGGRRDWRLPTIKELFSLSDFRGSENRRFYIDDVFDFAEPDASILQNDRFASTHRTSMMGQTWSSTIYTGVHYGRPGVEAAFFYNFLDGHIKQAPTQGRAMGLFYRCASGPEWGINDFHVKGDGTVTDRATDLMWQQVDDGRTRDWVEALQYCEGLTLAGYDDWRLPNVKELQTIVDYTKNDPALDQRYLQQTDKKAWFWSSTTHGDNISMASYICFGKCVSAQGIDTHGAGAQRSDPKTGDPNRWASLGGQEDDVRIKNAVRCVR